MLMKLQIIFALRDTPLCSRSVRLEFSFWDCKNSYSTLYVYKRSDGTSQYLCDK